MGDDLRAASGGAPAPAPAGRSVLRGMKPVGGWLAGIVSAVVATVLATWLLTPKSDADGVPFTVATRVLHGSSNGEGWIVSQ